MKNLLLVLTCLIGVCDSYAATRPSTTMTGAASSPVSRAVRTAPVASRTSATTSGGAKSVSARSATARPSQPSTQPQSAVRGRSATTPTSSNARAATKQNVISTGTKVAAATQNTVVDEVCWTKFSGCMDSFCMLDNANGGRCICSDKNAEFDSILAEIQELDNQSYQMATVGVERLEMGDDADAVMSKTDAVTKSIIADSTKPKRQSLDLSSWDIINVDFDAAAEDIFSLSSDGNSMSNKTGDALYRASAKLCNEQIPECASQSTLMDLMYKQRVRSDCTAYENSLRQQRTQSAQKLASAQSAMREAALEQYRAANKYDLGQCTVEFKKCMQTTGGCGDDFTGCVTQQTTRDTLLSAGGRADKPQMHSIKGKTTNISIAKWTYDALESKKPLCMGVTKQCANVANQVWDTFLREVAPQVKSAELMAESDLLTSCVSNISGCFQRACRENIDPNDPDGSYDACLTRPEVFEKVCSVEIEPCDAAVPNLMDYVRARLASMRVDSCTREFKSCLQSEDRCGEDYTQCVGLDTDTIVRLCPADKLIGCQHKDDSQGIDNTSSTAVYNRLAEIAQGIFLNIDNNMLSLCQRAADEAMIKVCGSTTNCNDLTVDNGAGTRSFKYEICEYDGLKKQERRGQTNSMLELNWTGVCRESLDGLSKAELQHEADGANTEKGWAGKLSGLVYWGEIGYSEDLIEECGGSDGEQQQIQVPRNAPGAGQCALQTKFSFTPMDKYISNVEQATGNTIDKDSDEYKIIRDRVYGMEVKALTSAVEQAINAIESDPTVGYCMYGRKFQGMRGTRQNDGTISTNVNDAIMKLGSDKTEARFPNLTSQMRQVIAMSALKTARDNYMEKYDEEMERMMKDQVKAAQLIDEKAAKDRAYSTCIAYGNSGTLPVTDGPKASNAGKWVVAGVLLTASVLLMVLPGTQWLGLILGKFGTTAALSLVAGAAAVGVGIDAANNPVSGGIEAKYGEHGTEVGQSCAEQWNYKECLKTIPNYETGECVKIKTTQNCAKTKKDYCDEWEAEVETTETIKLID